jgi:hypothetical protein
MDEALTEAVVRTRVALTVAAVLVVAVAMPVAAVAVDLTGAADFSAAKVMVVGCQPHHDRGVLAPIEAPVG